MLNKKGFFVTLVFILVISLLASPALAKTYYKASKETPGETAYEHVTYLAGKFGDRPAGTEDEERAAAYLYDQFTEFGYGPEYQEFNFEHDATQVDSQNVIAVKEGKSDKQIIIGAHYDTVDGVEGVEDNGSGVGVMLEVAENLQDLKTPYTIKFIGFGAEELGLVGSEHYVSQMSEEEINNTVAMINLDSLAAGDNMHVYGNAGEKGWVRDLALNIAKKRKLDVGTNPGLNEHYPAGTTGDWSDHAPFKEAGIPYAYLEATNWELGDLDGYTQTEKHGEIWHVPEKDNLEFIQSEFPGRIEERLSTFSQLLTELVQKINHGTVERNNR